MISGRFAIALGISLLLTIVFSLIGQYPIRGLRNLFILVCYVVGVVMLAKVGLKQGLATWCMFGLIGGTLYIGYEIVARLKATDQKDMPQVSLSHLLYGQLAWPIMAPEAIECILAETGLLMAPQAKTHALATTAAELQEPEETMRQLAEEALDIAEKSFDTKLDYTPASIEKVEEILGRLHEEYQRRQSDEGMQGLATAFGAYVGEVIRRDEPGAEWQRHHASTDQPYPIHHGDDAYSFPCSWCYKRIINGPEDSILLKYAILKDNRVRRGPSTANQ